MTWIQKGNKKQLWFTLYLLVALIGLSILFVSKSNANNALDNKEVALVIHNWQDRPISSYSVNGMWGGNASAYRYNEYSIGAGGGLACCGIIKGDMVIVKWRLGVKGSQYDSGIRPKNYQTKITLPERKEGDDTLHVHFLPKNKIKLEWNNKNSSSYNPFGSSKEIEGTRNE
ncbi:DUF3304 domain-containing protein [Providencia burhodogranariea]|uniref:DUF3304 domain-containing protein n=1 Tax=Providencia burhodogranariea DSM 19968 TaxID=1141662 RepID=K8WVI0_9GAMM|nr:DUF3304 domain-containing protein [Providencia burhodogranariea]EKT60215.1 hypothetical protein OOA_12400 [Providencia burhodogranariea DSM 19968]